MNGSKDSDENGSSKVGTSTPPRTLKRVVSPGSSIAHNRYLAKNLRSPIPASSRSVKVPGGVGVLEVPSRITSGITPNRLKSSRKPYTRTCGTTSSTRRRRRVGRTPCVHPAPSSTSRGAAAGTTLPETAALRPGTGTTRATRATRELGPTRSAFARPLYRRRR